MYSIYTAATDGKLHLASWKVNASLLPPRRSPAGASLFLQVKLRRGRRIEMSNVTRYGNDTTLSREIFRKKRKTRKRDKKKRRKPKENEGKRRVSRQFRIRSVGFIQESLRKCARASQSREFDGLSIFPWHFSPDRLHLSSWIHHRP